MKVAYENVNPPSHPYSIGKDFGKKTTSHMFLLNAKEGRWDAEARIVPYGPIPIDPAAKDLNYAISGFEGLKGYKWDNGDLGTFRIGDNAGRFQRTATRLEMTPLPDGVFEEAVHRLLDVERDGYPNDGVFYIRPVMTCTSTGVSVGSGDEFLFYVIICPTGHYFKEGKHGGTRVSLTDKFGRVPEGEVPEDAIGIGTVKASANYGHSVFVADYYKAIHGSQQVVYVQKGLLTEGGAMNIGFVKNGKIITPKLNDLILPGITRNSLMQLFPVTEEDISGEQFIEDIISGAISEVFGWGTAAVVNPIIEIVPDLKGLDLEERVNERTEVSKITGKSYHVIRVGAGIPGPVGKSMYKTLTDIQYRRVSGHEIWVQVVPHFSRDEKHATGRKVGTIASRRRPIEHGDGC